MERIERNDMFMQIAEVVSKRSTCTRKKVGCVLVKDRRVIAVGYNGVLPGVAPSEGINDEGESKTVHAEANVIAFCAKHGIPTDDCTIFITLSPCEKCMELMIQAGIRRIYYRDPYRLTEGLRIANRFGIRITCHR